MNLKWLPSGCLLVLGTSLAACGDSSSMASTGAEESWDPRGVTNPQGWSGPGSPKVVVDCADCPPATGYIAKQCTTEGNVEYRLCKDGHHFTSVITTQAGALVIRTHPGNDPNGWGSSLYLHPFLSNTSGLAGAAATVTSITTTGIAVKGNGPVNGPGASTFGRWSWVLKFSYDAKSKTVWTTGGSGNVQLNASLNRTGADLDLFRISSNYLHDVPLLNPPGATGDTGDMKNVEVSGARQNDAKGNFHYQWIPPKQPHFYPRNTADQMTIDAVGQHNIVDTAAQTSGYQIAAAYKPGLTLTIASRSAGLPMIFGAAYDMTKASDFAADNVGITPIVLKSWTQTSTSFHITLVSTAIPGDP